MVSNNVIKTALYNYIMDSITGDMRDYVLLHLDEYSDDFIEYNLDKEDAIKQSLELAKSNNISLVKNSKLFNVLVNVNTLKVIGSIWIRKHNNRFSFDIVIDKYNKDNDLVKILLDSVIEEYQFQREINDEMGIDILLEIPKKNKTLISLLTTRYNFSIINTITTNTVLMDILY